MPLVDTEIKKAFSSDGPWRVYRDEKRINADYLQIGPNSIDVSLGAELLEIEAGEGGLFDVIDPRNPKSVSCKRHVITDEGFTVWPGHLYLASVRESFDCSVGLRIKRALCRRGEEVTHEEATYFYPVIDGRSTLARVGLSVHQTAGRGDYGFDGQFTLELACLLPIVLYPGMRIGQVYFEPLTGTPTQKYNSVYQGQTGPRPAVLGPDRI